MVSYHNANGVLEVRHRHEVVRIEAWGADSVRVRAAQYRIPDGSVGALDDARPAGPAGDVKIEGPQASLACGRLRAEVDLGQPGNLALYAGPGAEVASIYPRDNDRIPVFAREGAEVLDVVR
jgi:hypothetical protein